MRHGAGSWELELGLGVDVRFWKGSPEPGAADALLSPGAYGSVGSRGPSKKEGAAAAPPSSARSTLRSGYLHGPKGSTAQLFEQDPSFSRIGRGPFRGTL